MNVAADQRPNECEVAGIISRYGKTKDPCLRDAIVLQYRNLVESIGRRFTGSGEPLEDLVQEGYIGLITATDLYDASKGVKFSTYATHFIIGQIKHSLRDRGKIIKEPAWLQELNHKMSRIIDSLYQELGRQPTDEEIGQAMHLPEASVADLLTTREVFKVTSLDSDQGDAAPGVDMEKVKDDKCYTFQLPVEDKIVLEMAMDKLKIVEQKVIQEFYYTGLSQTEIARKLGISCNYVSHVLRNGTRKLKRILTTEEIREMQMELHLAMRRADAQATRTEGSVVDSVTGLYNCQYVLSRLDEELTRAVRGKDEVAIAVLTLGGMGDYAAMYSPIRRDDALCAIARTIRDSVRRCDIVGRTDDHEFTLILPHTGAQVSVVCNRVGNAVREMAFETGRARPNVSFTVDMGSAVYPMDAMSALQLFDIARERAASLDPDHQCEAA